jgi:hypothetical protein
MTMWASLLNDWFGFPNGSVLTNLVASVLVGAPTVFLTLRHLRCRYCWRPARIPIAGTPHHACKRHAREHGHVHT